MNILQNFKARLQLRDAIKKADEAHQKTGERFYVLPLSQDRAKLVIMDRHNFRLMKRKRYIGRDVFVKDLERECFYFTPYCNGSCSINSELARLKLRQYLDWYAYCIKKSKSKNNEVHEKR